MSEQRKNNTRTNETSEARPSVVRRDAQQASDAFSFAAPAASSPFDVPVPTIPVGAFAAMQRQAAPEKEPAYMQIPTGAPSPVPAATATAQQRSGTQSKEPAYAQIPTGAPGPAPVVMAVAQQKEANSLNSLLPVDAKAENSTAREVSSVQARSTPRAAAPAAEPQPKVEVKPNPQEVVKTMDPVVVAERAQLSNSSLDAAQNVAFTLRQMKDGKETAHDAVARIEKDQGPAAADKTRSALESLGVDTRKDAAAPTKQTLESASAVADTAVLASFRDFREQQALAGALAPEVLAAAKETLAARQTAETQAAATATASATPSSDAPPSGRDAEINNTTSFLQAKATAAGLQEGTVDAITATELLAVAKDVPADTLIRLESEGSDGSARSVSFTAGEMVEAARGIQETTAQQAKEADKQKTREDTVQVAVAEMEMGD